MQTYDNWKLATPPDGLNWKMTDGEKCYLLWQKAVDKACHIANSQAYPYTIQLGEMRRERDLKAANAVALRIQRYGKRVYGNEFKKSC